MVFGDLEGQLMAENDAGGVTPLWAAFQVGYRRELDAVWAGRLFRAKSSRGKEDACGMVSKIKVWKAETVPYGDTGISTWV